MIISEKSWSAYLERLRRVNDKAANLISQYIQQHDITTKDGHTALLEYVEAVVGKYSEGAAEAACEMYDAIAEASGKVLPAAEPAQTPTFGDIAKTLNGTMKYVSDPDGIGASCARLVKRTGVDTTMKNAIRDGAEWAWVPHGDTCGFCLMLASNGWQKASKKALKGGHAEHIHANCDCTYAIRFDGKSNVAGYNPERYREEYDNAEGTSWKEKMRSMERADYSENKDAINARKRNEYDRRKTLIEAANPYKNPKTPLKINAKAQSKHIVGSQQYNKYVETHEYPPSYLTITESEAQDLIEKYHGTGILKLNKNGDVMPSEMIVDNDKIVGCAVNNRTGEEVQTTGFKIHYSDDGTHIVPMYENQKEYWKERRSRNGNDWLLRQKS